MKSSVLCVILISILVASDAIMIFPPCLADSSIPHSWVWQTGIESYTSKNTTAVEMELTIPSGEINSTGNLHNYIWVYTNTGNFIQIGIIFRDAIQPKTLYHEPSIFYSNGVNPIFLDAKYVEGHHYTFRIYFDGRWWVQVRDDSSNKESFVALTWARGSNISQAGVYLESIALSQQDLVDTAEEIDTLSNIYDETFGVFTNATWLYPNHHYTSTNVAQMVGDYVVHYVSPPTTSVFSNSGDMKYKVGFTQQIQSSAILNTSDLMTAIKEWGGYSSVSISDVELLSKMGINAHHIPSWCMKIIPWIIDGEVSLQDFVNAINYMYEDGIIHN